MVLRQWAWSAIFFTCSLRGGGARSSCSCTLHNPSPVSPLWGRNIWAAQPRYQTVASTDATVLGGECKWLEAQGAEGQQQTSVRRSGVQRSGVIDRSPVLHVYASVAEIELFTKFRIRLFDDYEIQSHSVGVDKHSVEMKS